MKKFLILLILLTVFACQEKTTTPKYYVVVHQRPTYREAIISTSSYDMSQTEKISDIRKPTDVYTISNFYYFCTQKPLLEPKIGLSKDQLLEEIGKLEPYAQVKIYD